MKQFELEVIAYGVSAYGFLMEGITDYSLKELAIKIKEYYSLDNFHNKTVYKTLIKYGDYTV